MLQFKCYKEENLVKAEQGISHALKICSVVCHVTPFTCYAVWQFRHEVQKLRCEV